MSIIKKERGVFMGSFSWLKADGLTNVSNVASGRPFKFLIPKEFGGGFIKENYQDYGDLGTKEDGTVKYDMYELLAFWNNHLVGDKKQYELGGTVFNNKSLRYNGAFPLMKETDEHTENNRSLGIGIGCYDAQIDNLKYPLKLVSDSYQGTYEDLDTRSYGDPAQGFFITRRT